MRMYVILLHENKIYGTYDEEECQYVVPMQVLALEHDVCHDGKDCETDALLHHLELYQRERTPVSGEPEPVGRYLAAIFEEGDAP